MRSRAKLKPFRVRLEIDVVAPDRNAAEHLSGVLCDMLRGRWWIKDVLPDGIEERVFLSQDQP